MTKQNQNPKEEAKKWVMETGIRPSSLDDEAVKKAEFSLLKYYRDDIAKLVEVHMIEKWEPPDGWKYVVYWNPYTGEVGIFAIQDVVELLAIYGTDILKTIGSYCGKINWEEFCSQYAAYVREVLYHRYLELERRYSGESSKEGNAGSSQSGN